MRAAVVAAVVALLTASCSLPSFDEREAQRQSESTDAPTVTTGLGNDENTTSTTEDLTTDLPDPTWSQLALDARVMAEYENPITAVARSGSDDIYVGLRDGVIRRIQRTFNSRGAERVASSTSTVLDISEQVSTDSERGLLDIAFSLDGRSLFVSFTDLSGDSVVNQYDIARTTRARADSVRELIRVPQPFANHNGGDLEIGADGFLYYALGDGGSGGDPEGNGQDTNTLLGSILRIDPNPAEEGDPYLIPDGNPFVDGGGAPEVFIYGVRNPWRFSFDTVTGDMWIADVGQNQFEEINLLPFATGGGRGANLGWNGAEGFEPFDDESIPENHTPPLYVYPHEGGRCSVTGGHVYRGAVMPLLEGVYIFGDYCTGELFGLQLTDVGPLVRELSYTAPRNELVSIGQGNDGEIYLVASGGQILRLQPAEATADG